MSTCLKRTNERHHCPMLCLFRTPTWLVEVPLAMLLLPIALLVGAMLGACEQALNDAIAFVDGRGAEDEHRA